MPVTRITSSTICRSADLVDRSRPIRFDDRPLDGPREIVGGERLEPGVATSGDGHDAGRPPLQRGADQREEAVAAAEEQ
jgi:hypothetical protein